MKNNIIGFTTSVSNKLYLRSPETITGTFTCDYNLYWNSTYANPFNDKYNLTLWKTFGYDNHSPNAISSLDPLFINASGTYSTARGEIGKREMPQNATNPPQGRLRRAAPAGFGFAPAVRD